MGTPLRSQCVCVRERNRERETDRDSVCVRERERERERDRQTDRDKACVCVVCERERERERESERDLEVAAHEARLEPEVNYLPRFSPLLICLERSPLRVDRSREIHLFENLDIVHIRLLVVCSSRCFVGAISLDYLAF